MATILEAMTVALQHHNAGRLPAAEEIYGQVLAMEPEQADALHLLGVIAHQVGRDEEAVEYLERAIGVRPKAAEFHNSLAKAYHALGRIPEAVDCYRRALDLGPGLADAHNNLGVALRGLGENEQAVACFRRALELRPDYVQGLNNLGNALREVGAVEEAMDSFRRALTIDPNFAVAHNNLGLTLSHQGRLDDAIGSYRRTLMLNPDFVEAHRNLGLALLRKGWVDDSVACFRRALELNPDFALAHDNLGSALQEQGKVEEAVASFRRALELDAGFEMARFNLAVGLLLLGQHEEGWTDYEARFTFLPRGLAGPRWNQEFAEGQTILLHFEGGFGDTLHFLRHATLVRERTRASRIILECQPELVRLLERNVTGGIEVIEWQGGRDAPRPRYDWHASLLSLPLALRRFEPWATAEPYVRADPEDRARWRERITPGAGLRVGIAWRGSATHQRDGLRSIPGEKLLPLLRTPGVQLYSLQMGPSESESAMMAAAGVIDLTTHIRDFAETAALASELDLIISVDTSLAHLAGALGRPVWTMVSFVPDWRWGMEGESTPWYPTMRLFRQTERGDWDSVLRRVGEELARVAKPE